MMEQMRGKKVAVTGAVLQLLFTAVMLTIWLWTESLAAMSATWVLAAGLPLWLIAAVLFYCRQLQKREEIELAEITARGGGHEATIFGAEADQELRPAAARAEALQRWAVPVFTLMWAALQIAVGVVTLSYLLAAKEPVALSSAAAGGLIALVVWFGAFLFSRYCTGMGTQPQWRLLRATGSYMLACTILVAVTVGTLLASTQNYSNLDRYLAFIAPAVQLVLAIELLLNFVLDIYRPRVAGKEQRDSFDSRLLNLIAQPGRVGHSIAETLNYQFGFEVSGTWFYQLLSRAMVPLIMLGAIFLLAASSVVIVHEGQEGILLHLGARQDESLAPGLHAKWPWPIDTVRMYDTGRVYELTLGAGGESGESGEERHRGQFVKGTELALWSEEHGDHEELNFVVARQAGEGDEAPPVAIVKFVVLMRYRIDDARKFDANSSNSAELVEAAAWREMARFCASATLTEELGEGRADRPNAIMTSGRSRVAELLTPRIRGAVADLDIGVNVTSVNVMAIHPPPEAAGDYEKVLQAERGRDTQRYEALAKANEILAQAAGTPERARSLALAIRVLDELKGLQVSKGGELKSLGSKYLARARSDLDAIKKDLRRQELLGDVSADSKAYRKDLAAYIKLLERIGAPGGEGFADDLASASKKVDVLFADAYGAASISVVQATAYRWQRELKERGDHESFEREILAYQACPSVYQNDRYLDVWDAVLPSMQKYVQAVDLDRLQFRLNLEESVDAMSAAMSGSGATGR